ncbi:MAG: DMT family transporter [Candidatus Thorarchaeota archaeon]
MISTELNVSQTSADRQIRIARIPANYAAPFALLIANLIWGITPIFTEVALLYLSPLQATTLRFGAGVIFLSVFLYVRRGIEGFSVLSSKMVIVLGWIDALAYLAATFGQDLTTPGLSTLLGSFYVFLVPFISWKLEKEPLTSRIAVVGVISFFGMFLISWQGDFQNLVNLSVLGPIVLLLAAILWGFYTVLTSKYVSIKSPQHQKIDMLSFTYGSLFHTFIALLILSLLTKEFLVSFPPALVPHILFFGLFPGLALGLWNWAIARLGAVSTSFFQLLQTILPFFLEIVLFGQMYTMWIYAGILLILASSLWASEGKNESESASTRKKIDQQGLHTLEGSFMCPLADNLGPRCT